jgi:hypothetical protein
LNFEALFEVAGLVYCHGKLANENVFGSNA